MKQNQCRQLSIEDNDAARVLYGQNNENLKFIERTLNVKIGARGGELCVDGEPADAALAFDVVSQLAQLVAAGYPLENKDVSHALRIIAKDRTTKLTEFMLSSVRGGAARRYARPKSSAQKAYIDAIRESDLVFGIGPAGTGKTYLAVAMAVSFLLEKRVQRIVLTRPAVEAGERLGFLPGTLEEKVNPYLRPLYDALLDMVEPDKVNAWQESGVIEIAPLAYMRGRTLNSSFIILDEAQNTTGEQMKMFLTRMGNESKAVVTGDVTQIDIKEPHKSGLAEARRILKNVPEIRFCNFTDVDVVRHNLVQKIIVAYEDYNKTGGKDDGKDDPDPLSGAESERT